MKYPDEYDDYRMLADHIIEKTNPADEDVSEVSIMMDAVTRLTDVVASIDCKCPAGSLDDHGAYGACARCRALDQFQKVNVQW